MRENRLYGSEGGGALTRSPYPYRWRRQDAPRDPWQLENVWRARASAVLFRPRGGAGWHSANLGPAASLKPKNYDHTISY